MDWPPILADVATGRFTQAQVAERWNVSPASLSRQIKDAAAAPPTDREQIIDRLFRVVELQVLDLQREMNVMQVENRRSGEKEVVLLGKIAANLEKLMALDGAGPSATRKTRNRSKDIVDLRSKLIERIEHLKRQ